MKRDWELIRKILIKLESKVDDTPLDSKSFKGVYPEKVIYHYKILAQAELIQIEDSSTMGEEDYSAINLTWSGHEFLDKIRNEDAWNKIKSIVKTKGVDMSFDVIKTVGQIVITSLFTK